MTAYYNEIDPYAAQWLRNLIDAGHIARGDVDERSIVDVRADDLAGYNQCHFFAGIGGWSYALRLAGWPDTRPVWSGSCPCQPFSLAGARRGFADERHLWPVWLNLIRERRPAKVYGEQVASAAEWLRLVRGDLEALGYAVGAIPIEAASAGADHLRDRFWFVADGGYSAGTPGQPRTGCETQGAREENDHSSERYRIVADSDNARSQGRIVLPERAGERTAGADGVAYAAGERGNGREDTARPSGRHVAESDGGDLPDTTSDRRAGQRLHAQQWRPADPDAFRRDGSSELSWVIGADGKERRIKSGVRLLAHGIPNRVGLLRGFGNAIDPRPAAEFIRASA